VKGSDVVRQRLFSSVESIRHGVVFHCAIGTIGTNVERTRGFLDNFARDDDFLDAREITILEVIRTHWAR
jgi:hypothetical protein